MENNTIPASRGSAVSGGEQPCRRLTSGRRFSVGKATPAPRAGRLPASWHLDESPVQSRAAGDQEAAGERDHDGPAVVAGVVQRLLSLDCGRICEGLVLAWLQL